MKHTKVLALSAVIAAAISSGASANNPAVEFHVDAGRIFFEDTLNDSNIWDLGVGFALSENWMLDLVASRWDSEAGLVDVDGTQYRADLLYHINTESAWRPYVAFGVGDQEREFNAADPSSERDTLLNLGAGIKRSLGDSWQFRTDVRAFNSLDNEYTDLAVTAGIGFVFGGTSAPAAAPVVVAPVEVDSDGDGVFDSKDQCPDTPKTHKVDAVGCSLKLTESVAIELNITFDTAKSIIKPEFDSEVANLATFMNQYADTVVTVEGHTDSQGSDAYNQKLSQSRADAVKAALITKYGIGADRVNAIGYGEAKPIADNMNAAGREQNRRVVGQVSTAVTKTETRN